MYENIGRASFHARCCVPALSGCCAFNSIPMNITCLHGNIYVCCLYFSC